MVTAVQILLITNYILQEYEIITLIYSGKTYRLDLCFCAPVGIISRHVGIISRHVGIISRHTNLVLWSLKYNTSKYKAIFFIFPFFFWLDSSCSMFYLIYHSENITNEVKVFRGGGHSNFPIHHRGCLNQGLKTLPTEGNCKVLASIILATFSIKGRGSLSYNIHCCSLIFTRALNNQSVCTRIFSLHIVGGIHQIQGENSPE